MLLSVDPGVSSLIDLGWVELLALPAVPVANAARLRYDIRVASTVDGDDWFLRSAGLDFDLASPRWPGRRWWSYGWGLVDGTQVPDLFLAQARTTRPDLRVAQLKAAVGDQVTVSVSAGHDDTWRLRAWARPGGTDPDLLTVT